MRYRRISTHSARLFLLGSLCAGFHPAMAQEVGPPPTPPGTEEEPEEDTESGEASETAPVETAPTIGAPPAPPTTEEAPGGDTESPEAEQVAEKATGEKITLILKNGQVLSGIGHVPESEDEAIQIELVAGAGPTTIERDVIAEIQMGYAEVVGDLPYLGHQRYLYAPSAMPMKKGTGYISQKELFFTAVGYAVTDNISILGGTIVPLALWSIVEGEPDALLGVLGARYARQIGEKLYAGVGFEGFAFNNQDDSSLTMPFANMTYGEPESHVSLGLGIGLTDWERAFHPVVVAGTHRVHERLALISENWLILAPETDSVETFDATNNTYESETVRYWSQPKAKALITSFGVRFLSERVTTDLVLINSVIEGDYFPFPWLDVAWHFGH
jgi:hypothetical protein